MKAWRRVSFYETRGGALESKDAHLQDNQLVTRLQCIGMVHLHLLNLPGKCNRLLVEALEVLRTTINEDHYFPFRDG